MSSNTFQIIGSETSYSLFLTFGLLYLTLQPFTKVTEIMLGMIELCCEITKFPIIEFNVFTNSVYHRREEIHIVDGAGELGLVVKNMPCSCRRLEFSSQWQVTHNCL